MEEKQALRGLIISLLLLLVLSVVGGSIDWFKDGYSACAIVLFGEWLVLIILASFVVVFFFNELLRY